MTAKWEKTEPNVGVLEIEVDHGKVTAALERAFKKVVQRVAVPGFRKGKVPRKIFEARFGIESLYQDALDILLPEAYSVAVKQAELEPVDRPTIDVVQMEAGKPLLFKATVTVKPEVKLGDYQGITYEDKSFSIGDEEIQAELDRIREGHAELHVVSDGVAQEKDTLVLDFQGFVDGETFDGGEAENYQLELGSGTFVPGFEEQLVGAAAGDDKEVVITFPDEYHVKALAGKEARFQVHVHDIKRRILPELNDDFAKDVSEFDTFEEFRADVVKGLEHHAEHEHEHFLQDAVLTKVVDGAEIDIPAVMINDDIDAQMRDFARRLEQQGIPLDAYQEFTGATTEDLRSQFQDRADRNVRTSLVIDAIAKAENIDVTDDEIDLEVQKIADGSKIDFALAKRLLAQRDFELREVKEQIQARKVIDFLMEHSVKA